MQKRTFQNIGLAAVAVMTLYFTSGTFAYGQSGQSCTPGSDDCGDPNCYCPAAGTCVCPPEAKPVGKKKPQSKY